MSTVSKIDQYIKIDILPSPKNIKNVEFSCCQKPVDGEHEPKLGTLYYNTKSLLTFEVADEFGNIIERIEDDQYDVTIEPCALWSPLNWEMKDGKISAIFCLKMIEEDQMIIRLIDRRSNSQESTCTARKHINILYPPCSPSLTLKFFDDHLDHRCTAGKEFTLDVQLYDVFGKPVVKDSKETCNIVVEAPRPKTAKKQHGKEHDEMINIRKINESENASFSASVHFKVAGSREVKLIAKSGLKSKSKYLYVEVLPSIPDHLRDVEFKTHGAIDKNFAANPAVMYREQWSILEASIVDYYENVVQGQNQDYNVSLNLFNEKREKMEMTHKVVEIRNGKLSVEVMISEAGKHNLLITLTNRGNPDQVFPLKEIQVQVNDAPFYLAGTKFPFPDTCVAGKEFQLEIIPRDVFGCPLPVNSTVDCNLRGVISSLEVCGDGETIDFQIVKNESNIRFCFSIVLTTAGRRKLTIFDKDDKSKEFCTEVKPDLNDVHWKPSASKETVYRRENLILTLRKVDCCNNEVRPSPSESIPDLRQQAGPDGGLHWTEKRTQDNTVTIYFKQTGKYDLCLADRDGGSLEGTSFSVIVQEAPIDRVRSSVTWLPQYDDMQDQPVFPEDESFRCCLKLKDVVGFNYDGKISKECIKVKCGKAEVKDITVSSSSSAFGSYNIVVPLKNNLLKNDPNPKFWYFVNGVRIEKPLLLPTFEGFQGYDDDDCFVMLAERSIVCRHVRKREIIGKDFCHLNNIKRVCELDEDPEFIEGKEDEIIRNLFVDCDRNAYDEQIGAESDESDVDDVYDDSDDEVGEDNDDEFICTIIKLPLDEIECRMEQNPETRTPEEIEYKIKKFRNILLHLLRANYYRNDAFEIDKAREEWKNRASESYEKSKAGGNKDLPHFCSKIKEKYARLMSRYHDAACEEFFKFFNTGRCHSEIDLHGLLVADERKLQDYKRQLQRKGRLTNAEVERKIKEERRHGNEAVRKLRERLDKCDMKKAKKGEEPWLEIIVGSGHHSKVRQQIRPKVEHFLKKERRLKFSPVNKGALVITFKKYAGREPCFGEYYCPKCDNRWRNGRSWIGKWQTCYDCHKKEGSYEKCYPLKQRSKRKRQSYNPKVDSGSWKPSHVEELCEKCIELGKLCTSSPV